MSQDEKDLQEVVTAQTVNSEQRILLDGGQTTQLNQLIQSCSALQLAWASGFLAAKSTMTSNIEFQGNASIAESGLVKSNEANAQVVTKTLTILYASQTGNAKGVAAKVVSVLQEKGIKVNLLNIVEYKTKKLKSETHLIIIASTNGEGEPPDDAISFHDFLLGTKAPKLAQLKYSVLALGDSSYEFFCQTGKDFDGALEKLGAKAILPRLDCDLDYDVLAREWTSTISVQLATELTQSSANHQDESVSVNALDQISSEPTYHKNNPYNATFLLSQKITGRDSNKDVVHIEIDLDDSGICYEVGDVLGVYFDNNKALVSNVLSLLKANENELISLPLDGKEEKVTIEQALIAHLELTQSNAAFVKYWAAITKNEDLLEIVNDSEKLRLFANSHQVIDVISYGIENLPADFSIQLFSEALRRITPRLYSIASSQKEVENEVHLTLAVVHYQQQGEQRYGGASRYLAHELQEGQKVKVFIEDNNNFRLPSDTESGNNTPIIMIGAGTGVAPFRAFLQERDAREATGDNWLFFGEQTFTQDFLYQVEWQGYLKSTLLTRLDVAFSRDQANKIYVQDRLKEQGKDVFSWLQRGAHFYICGDASHMAKDVHQALIEIITEHGQLTNEDAIQYLKTLQSNKRYQKDVY